MTFEEEEAIRAAILAFARGELSRAEVIKTFPKNAPKEPVNPLMVDTGDPGEPTVYALVSAMLSMGQITEEQFNALLAPPPPRKAPDARRWSATRIDHQWAAVGRAPFSQDQAVEWGERGQQGVIDTSLELTIGEIVCLMCDATFLDASDECRPLHGSPRHRWVSTTKTMLTPDEARSWYLEQTPPAGFPKVTQVLCTLCGIAYDDAPTDCPERAFWLGSVTRETVDGHE